MIAQELKTLGRRIAVAAGIVLALLAVADEARAEPGYATCLVAGNRWCGGPVNPVVVNGQYKYLVVHRVPTRPRRLHVAFGLPRQCGVDGTCGYRSHYTGGIRKLDYPLFTRCIARGAKVTGVWVRPTRVFFEVVVCGEVKSRSFARR